MMWIGNITIARAEDYCTTEVTDYISGSVSVYGNSSFEYGSTDTRATYKPLGVAKRSKGGSVCTYDKVEGEIKLECKEDENGELKFVPVTKNNIYSLSHVKMCGNVNNYESERAFLDDVDGEAVAGPLKNCQVKVENDDGTSSTVVFGPGGNGYIPDQGVVSDSATYQHCLNSSASGVIAKCNYANGRLEATTGSCSAGRVCVERYGGTFGKSLSIECVSTSCFDDVGNSFAQGAIVCKDDDRKMCNKGGFDLVENCTGACAYNQDLIAECSSGDKYNTGNQCNTLDGVEWTSRTIGTTVCSSDLNKVYVCKTEDKPYYTFLKDCENETVCGKNKTTGEYGCWSSDLVDTNDNTSSITLTVVADSAYLCDGGKGIQTALGCIPYSMSGLAGKLLPLLFGIAGGISFLLMVFGFIMMATSSGDEKKLIEARSRITSAITGLLVSIFAIFLFRLIFSNILKIPGL